MKRGSDFFDLHPIDLYWYVTRLSPNRVSTSHVRVVRGDDIPHGVYPIYYVLNLESSRRNVGIKVSGETEHVIVGRFGTAEYIVEPNPYWLDCIPEIHHRFVKTIYDESMKLDGDVVGAWSVWSDFLAEFNYYPEDKIIRLREIVDVKQLAARAAIERVRLLSLD